MFCRLVSSLDHYVENSVSCVNVDVICFLSLIKLLSVYRVLIVREVLFPAKLLFLAVQPFVCHVRECVRTCKGILFADAVRLISDPIDVSFTR